MMTNFSTARKIYDELSQKIADREITGPLRSSTCAGLARDAAAGAHGCLAHAAERAADHAHASCPVVPSRSNAGAGAGTRIMLATTVSEAEIAELEANAYGWDADDAEDQNAEVISFLQLIARDEPLVVVRALYPSASAPPPRLDDPVYQQKIKDFLKARGLPEKPGGRATAASRTTRLSAGPTRGLCPSGWERPLEPPAPASCRPRACYNCGKTGHLAASCPAQAQTLEAAVRRALAEHAAAAAAPPVPPATPAPWADPNAFTIARAMLEQAARSGAAGPSATALLPAPTGGHGSGPTAAPAPAELGKEKHVYRVRIVRSDEALVDDTFRAFTAAAAAHAAALQDPGTAPLSTRPVPHGSREAGPLRGAGPVADRPESGLDEGEKKVAFDAVEGADAAAKGPAPTPVPTSFPAELAAGIVDAALEEVALLLAAAPDPTEVEGADAEAKASLEVTDDGASLADEDATVASKETLRLNRARLLSASPGLDLTHFGAVELEPVKGREHELGPVPLWNVDAHKLKGAASVPLDARRSCTQRHAGHDPLSQDTLAHAWPTHYYEIMSLTHQASRVAANRARRPQAYEAWDECVATAGWLEPYRRHWSIGQHSPVAASLEPHEMTVSGRRQLIELSELLPAQDRLRLACASTVAGYFLHRVDYGAPGTAGAVEKILGRFFKFAEPLMVDARVDAYGFALLALEHAIQWKTVACIGGRAALAERLTAYRDGRAPAFPVLPLHGTTRGGQLPTIVPEELYVLSQLGPRPPLTALLLKKRAGFNDEAVKDMIALVEKWRTDAGSRTPTPLHDLPTTPKPASDTTGAYTAKAVSATIKEAKACLPPRPPVKALSPRDPPAPARPAPVPVPPPAPTAKLVTLHAAATWPPLASPMAPRPTAAPTPPATEPRLSSLA
eukprot:tig00000331_g24164.t1